MNPYRIPFNKPFIIGRELDYIREAILRGHIAGNGEFTRKCQSLLEEKFDCKKVLLTTSGTAALEMAALLCDVQQGDEVILPSFTFVSTANAFCLRGAKLKFVDINPHTLNIDEKQLQAAMGASTKIIVPVHYAGVSCEMNTIVEIAKKQGLYVVEDVAQGVSSKYEDKFLGTIGDLGAFSFHETKNFICGEGGALCINKEQFIERAEIIWEKGTNRSQFFKGTVDKYTWVDIGSSFLPADIVAAFLYAQLEHMDEINKKRKQIFDYYYDSLFLLAQKGCITLPMCSQDRVNNNHMFYLILKSEKMRTSLIEHLKMKGIMAVFHYMPLHLSKVGVAMGYGKGDFPVTEMISKTILRLPFYYELSLEEQKSVIQEIYTFLGCKDIFKATNVIHDERIKV
ncbi:MAG: dTDP-4-amino-4,6-dideoxygalactose transaminase [Candidatus Omnitrophica bacterium]|nr:dTDP-4-amino-4,6-dideoxygalactose transaminase [Candidatus Omnitrophota bacterium]